MRSKLMVGVGLAGILALSSGLTVAGASTYVVSHISIKDQGLVFSGDVGPGVCASGRKVTVHTMPDGQLVGRTTTGSNGHWKITATGSPGFKKKHFEAKTKPHLTQNPGSHNCSAATSATIPYHQ